MNHPI